jgi:hypothetical protein
MMVIKEVVSEEEEAMRGCVMLLLMERMTAQV